MKRKIGALDILLPALCLALALGVAFVFGPCGPKEDGGYMTCRWAGRAVLGLGIAMTALALIRLLLPRRARLGADAGLIACAGAAIAMPGTLIHLCMMESMRCRAVTRPAVTVLCAVIAAAALLDAALQIRRERQS